MSVLLNGANDAASDQISGIQQGLSQATGSINQGTQALNTNYGAALQPFMQNYAGAQQGTAALGNVLGLNGASGNQSANAALQTSPGYQLALRSGDNAVNAAAAANGTLNSGSQLSALSNQNQNIAQGSYNNYVSALEPYLGAQSQAASGIAGVNTGLGNQTNANQNVLGNMQYGANTSIGNANASKDLANQALFGNILGGGMNLLAGFL